MYDFDLLVIGAGSGGVRASRMAAATGARVAVAEERYLGGTCVNVGCVPKKLFYYGAHFHEDFSDAKGYGWDVSVNHFDWPTLRDNKNTEIARLNGIYQSMLENANVTIFPSRAEIIGPHQALIEGKTITAEKILIAAGGRPYVPNFAGAEWVLNSDDIFYLDQLPARALVVGGGYIAVEFAGIFQGLGVNTELAYRGAQLLRTFDEDLGGRLATEQINKGITVSLETDVESITKNDRQELTVTYKNGRIEDYDLVLYATGRKAYTANLGLESTQVELRSNGSIIVDDYFQTAEPSIFALGDIIGTPELTPVALAQGMAFVDGQFKQQPRAIDYSCIPTAVFCQPNIATVGLTEAEAIKQFNEISIYRSEFKTLKHSLSQNNERTFMKLIVDVASDKVIGIHMMGSEAGEIIQGLAVALKAGATKAVFDATIGVHPTIAEEFVTMRTAS
ncbi:MAG TPA: glutathione-disulfide reductase [Cellvibrionales bacterium]|nr:glutathione-disulfide reductase [Cellvibrionales bacterium]